MRRVPFDPQQMDGVGFTDIAGTKYSGKRYSQCRKVGEPAMLSSSNGWLCVLRAIRAHRYFCHFYDYHVVGLTMGEIAAKVRVDKSTISRRIDRLRADVTAIWEARRGHD